MQSTRILFVAFLTALVILSPVFGQEIQTAVFYPTDDAYVGKSGAAATLAQKNFGSEPTLQVSFELVRAEELPLARIAYLKFNLTLPEGSIIRSAFLKLFVISAVTSSSVLIVIPTKNTTWTETTITGKNAPDIPTSEKKGRDVKIDEVKITELKTWYSLNVTSYARSVRSGWLSLMVIGGNKEMPYTDIVSFYSKESPDEAVRPSLEVTYFPSESGGQRVVYLTLRSSHFGGSIQFNNTGYEVPKNLEIILDVPTGHYKIGASPTFLVNDSVRAVFEKWNDGSPANPREIEVNQTITVEAEYVELYYMNVTTQYGVADGAGWYGSGTSATARVLGDPGTNPPTVKVEGILGLLGVSYVFDHWSGYGTPGPSLRLVVDGPVTVTAIWRQEYSLLYSNLIRAALSLGAGFVAAMAVRRTSMRRGGGLPLALPFTRRAKLPPAPKATIAPAAPIKMVPSTQRAESVSVPRSIPIVTPASPTKFCWECGVKIRRDSKYCQECGKKLV